jgi:hypothetical protein
MSTFTPLVVVARPGDTKPRNEDIPSTNPKNGSQTSPHFVGLRMAAHGTVYSRFRSQFWKVLKDGNSVEPTERNLSSLIAQWAHTLWVWCGFPPTGKALGKDIRAATVKLRSVLKSQGALGLILYLKVSYLAIQKFVAKQPLSSTYDLGTRVALANGLPKWLPVSARKAIRSGHKPSIRLWLSILYTFKAMKSPKSYSKVQEAVQKVISEPLDLSSDMISKTLGDYKEFLTTTFIPLLGGRRPLPTVKEGTKAVASPFFAAGSNGSVSVLSAGVDACTWWTYAFPKESGLSSEIHPLPGDTERLYNYLVDIMYLNDDTAKSGLHDLMDQMKQESNWSSYTYQRNHSRNGRPPCLGRIHALFEAAGKIRLIGILDYWTQRALKPLHDDLFEVLKDLPWDGTFNQDRLFARLKKAHMTLGSNTSSLDISSATDIIPKELYEVFLDELYYPPKAEVNPWTNSIITPSFGRAVIGLMTDRDFLVPFETTGKIRDTKDGISIDQYTYEDLSAQGIYTAYFSRNNVAYKTPWPAIRYRRGQPMGAYASFALLALWHHSWIHFSAYRVGMQIASFDEISSSEGPKGLPVDSVTYGVVGDDSAIVEFNPSSTVATEYLDLCAKFGITIKLSKSFPSCRALSFLSRFASDSAELSPASFKEELHVDSFSARANFVCKLIGRGWLEGYRNSISGLIRMSMDHYTYMLRVLPFRHFNRIPSIGYRALMALLGPSSPIVEVSFDKGQIGRRELLHIWLALAQGKKPIRANFEDGSNFVFDTPPALSVSSMLLSDLYLRLKNLISKVLDHNCIGNRHLMLNAPELWFNRLTPAQSRLTSWKHISSEDRALIPYKYMRDGWFTGCDLELDTDIKRLEVKLYKSLSRISDVGTLDTALDHMNSYIDYAMGLRKFPDLYTNWLSNENREKRLSKPSITWELISNQLAEVAFAHWLLVTQEPTNSVQTVESYRELLSKIDEDLLLS